MSKRNENQIAVNNEIEKFYDKAIKDYRNCYIHKRLRNCEAQVYDTENYIFLKSYNTVVAIIDKQTRTLYDVLRLVYGYTATSSQHISKFSTDYARFWCEYKRWQIV